MSYSISIPIVEGKTSVETIRLSSKSFGFDQVVTLIRKEFGVPPYRLKNSECLSVEELKIRDLSIYLAAHYSETPVQDLVEFFSVSKELIVSLNALTRPNFLLKEYSHCQGIIEDYLHVQIPIDLETSEMLTRYELLNMRKNGISNEATEWITVSRIAICEKEREDWRALEELALYHEALTGEYGLTEVFFEGADPDLDVVCPLDEKMNRIFY